MDGATRSQLAERAGISVQYLCDIEEGRRKLKRNPGLINRLAETLNVPKSWLHKRPATEDEPTPKAAAAKNPNSAPKTPPKASRKAKAAKAAPK